MIDTVDLDNTAWNGRVPVQLAHMPSPVDELAIAVRAGRLVALCFDGRPGWVEAYCRRRFGAADFEAVPDPAGVCSALADYFSGRLDALDALPVDPGGTAFQQSVWLGLRMIPAGETLSYGAFAAQLGTPKAIRAVGRTNGLNPISIVLPCHRVIGVDGSMTGYGGGIERKEWLLRHEGALLL